MESDESSHLRNEIISNALKWKCDRRLSPDVHSGALDERFWADKLGDRFGTGGPWAVSQVVDEFTKTRRWIVEAVVEAVRVVAQCSGRRAYGRAALWIVRWRRRPLLAVCWYWRAQERPVLEAVVTSVKAVAVRWDKCVRVRSDLNVLAVVLIVAVLLDQHFLLRQVGVVLFQMLRRQWLAKRQLFGVADAQVLAQRHDRFEGLHREVDAAVQVTKIWDLQSRIFIVSSQSWIQLTLIAV